MKLWLLPVALVLFLNACTGTRVKEVGAGDEEAYKQRKQIIEATYEWGLVGRISLDDGDQGGSGKLQWRVDPDKSNIDFHGAMGRGAWHLLINDDGAVLREANGDEHKARGVDELIQRQMGWPIPVDALQWWARGLAAPGPVLEQQLDEQGLLTSLAQFGWQIEFNRYKLFSEVSMPIRLDARRDNYRVKLAVSRWQLLSDTDSR